LIAGKTVYLCYDIYDFPDSSDLPLPPGLRNSRSEFGIEMILILAFLHYWVGVSIDNAIQKAEIRKGARTSKSAAGAKCLGTTMILLRSLSRMKR